jgi:hypothetical protein
MECWALNCCKKYPKVIGIFSSKDKAIKKILKLMKKDFDELKDEKEVLANTVQYWFSNCIGEKNPTWNDLKEQIIKNPTWNDFKKQIIKQLQLEYGECDGLSEQRYLISKHIIDE